MDIAAVAAIAVAVGFFFGYLTRCWIRRAESGVLHVRHDEDGTYLTLQIRRLSDVLGHKEVTFYINEEPRE